MNAIPTNDIGACLRNERHIIGTWHTAHHCPMSHEGYVNKETWAVALYINNDQATLAAVRHAIREAEGPEVVVGPEGYEHADVRLLDWEAGFVIKDVLDALLEEIWNRDRITWRNIRDDFGSFWRIDWPELGASFLADLHSV